MSILPLTLLLLSPGAAQQPLAYLNAPIAPMITATFELDAGQHTINTTDLSGGSDTVLHVRFPSGAISTNDDVGYGNASSVSFILGGTTKVEVFVRAKDVTTGGTCDLLLNGSVVPGYAGRRFGLSPFNVASGAYFYDAVTTPAAAPFADLAMLGVDCNSGEVTVAVNDGGTGTMPSFLSGGVCGLYVGHDLDDLEVYANVYTNDVLSDDGDGDLLGAALEAALGTCDPINAPSWPAYCDDVISATDTDVDGISDRDEVMGHRDPDFPQYFPTWGADPRHKDVFVEVDYDQATLDAANAGDKTLWTEAKLVEMASHYLVGDATDVGNPDGQPGIRVHVDNGLTPTDPANRALFGNWGGLDVLTTTADADYYSSAAAVQNMHAARWASGWRWGLYLPSGGGQAKMSLRRFKFGATESFAHELGHILGLEHGGHEKFNCKPNYHSMMNYAYGMSAGFSSGLNPQMSPALVNEGVGLPFVEGQQDAIDTYRWDDTLGTGVDFSANGAIDAPLLRAPLTFAEDKSCAVSGHGNIILASGEDFGDASPQLAEHNGWIYALWTDRSLRLHTRRGPHSGNDVRGGCPDSDDPFDGTDCTTFLPDRLQAPRGIVGMDARVTTVTSRRGNVDYLVLAYRDARLQLQIQYTRIFSDGSLDSAWGIVQLPSTIRISADPELAEIDTSAGRQLVVILSPVTENGVLSSLNGFYAWSAVNLSSPAPSMGKMSGLAVDGSPSPIRGNRNISTAEYIDSAQRILCGVFPDIRGDVMVYCYDAGLAKWVERGSGLHRHNIDRRARPSLAYFRPRTTGGALATAQGRFWFQYPSGKNYAVPRIKYSVAHGPGADPLQTSPAPSPGHYGYFHSQWLKLRGNASVDLLGSPNISAMKAITLLSRAGKPDLLEFRPFANGTFNTAVADHNDFVRMRWGICASAGENDTQRCGAAP